MQASMGGGYHFHHVNSLIVRRLTMIKKSDISYFDYLPGSVAQWLAL